LNQTKVLYSKLDYERDLKTVQETENGKRPLDLSAFKRLMVHDLCLNTDVLKSYKIGNHSLEFVHTALNNPSAYGYYLIEISRYLMVKSQFYMRLNNYFSNMGLFNYNIDIYDVKHDKIADEGERTKLLDNYYAVLSEFEKMGFKHEMSKIMSILPSEDVYFGLIFEDATDFFIQRLSSSICRIRQVQDGVYNFKLNLSAINPLEIDAYPNYIKEAFIAYKNKQSYLDGWYIPPADKQVCFKFNQSCIYPMPILLPMIDDILDLDIYKKLKLQKARVDNYKAIIIEVPIDSSAVDKPLLTDGTLSTFAEMNKANMPDDIGLIHAPGSAEAISFKDNTNNTNNLSDAITNLYDNAGVSSQLFNSGSSGTAFKLSIENDAAFIYAFYRQCERYFNRLIKLRKYNKAAYKFGLRIQDSTVFNRETVIDYYLKASQSGQPFKIDHAVALGKSPSRYIGAILLENDILALHQHLVPLPTSYTTSTEEITGRPTNESLGIDLSEEGEVTQETDANLDR